jgi:glycosyltransferase involved in cell wall biosynthesis
LRFIRCLHRGVLKGHAWEQIELPWIARDGVLASFCSSGPWFKDRQSITVHDASVFRVPNAFSWRFRTWYRLMIRRIVRHAPRTMVVSDFSAREAQVCFGASAERLDVVSEGWQHFERAESDPSVLTRHGLSSRGYVLAVSSPTSNKNFALVSRAMQALRDLPLQFAVAGAADARVFAMEDGSAEGPVTRLGYVSDAELKTLYQNAMCFVFPSTYEGFGLPPLEAMALGCPVVVSRIEAVREVCGDAALYFDPGDANALAALLRRLFTARGELEQMRQRGRERAAEFSWSESARKSLASILKSVQALV